MIPRRDFMTLLGGAAVWPLAARAQQDRRVRRVGILQIGSQSEPVTRTQLDAVREGLAARGWIEGRNVQFEVRYAEEDPERMRAHAEELVHLTPDVIVAVSRPGTLALLQRTRSIPIVFSNVGDPLAGGLVKSVARPEGNATGATNTFHSLAVKWLETLKEGVPRTARAGLLFVPEFVNQYYLEVLDDASAALGVKVVRMPYHNPAELERTIDAFAAEPDGGLIVMPPPPSANARESINRLAIKYRLPTFSVNRAYAPNAVMISYEADNIEPSRIAASYVDRLLRGAKVSELPVQFPTKFKLVVNVKIATTIGLTIPAAFRLRADEVIE